MGILSSWTPAAATLADNQPKVGHQLCFSPFLTLRCDPGFSGPACETASQTFPMFISESFASSRLSSYHSFYSIRGAEVSFGCGVLASGKALVFNKDGRRQLVTSFLDSSQSRWEGTGSSVKQRHDGASSSPATALSIIKLVVLAGKKAFKKLLVSCFNGDFVALPFFPSAF